MSESLKDLPLFCTVVRTRSFVQASELLGLTPSAVSKAISRLESRIGTRLFIRSTRVIKLTEAGSEFYDRASRILEATEEAEIVAAGIESEPRGDLVVACSDAFATQIVVPMLSRFQSQYPKINVHLSQGDGRLDLLNESFDVAIRFDEPHQKGFAVVQLAHDPWVICASPDYLAKAPAIRHPKDLQGHRCMAIRARGSLSNRWDFRGGTKIAQTIEPVFSGIGMVVKTAALQGVGVARLAEFLVKEDVKNGKLVALLDDYQVANQRHIFAVTQDRAYMPEKVRVFVLALQERFR